MKNIILLSTTILFSIISFGQQTKKDTVNKLNEIQITNKYKYKS